MSNKYHEYAQDQHKWLEKIHLSVDQSTTISSSTLANTSQLTENCHFFRIFYKRPHQSRKRIYQDFIDDALRIDLIKGVKYIKNCVWSLAWKSTIRMSTIPFTTSAILNTRKEHECAVVHSKSQSSVGLNKKEGKNRLLRCEVPSFFECHGKMVILSCAVLFLLIFPILNLPLTAFGQPGGPVLRDRPEDDLPAAVHDPNLTIETVADELNHPTAMAFLGPDDILVLDKDNGTVRRIVGGEVQAEPVLDVAVANDNDTNERGMLGMAVAKQNETTTYVLLYFTESGGGQDGDDSRGTVPAGNRLYRYELSEIQGVNGSEVKLINPKLLLDLPARPGPRYNGGPLLVANDGENNSTTVYLMIGDLDHHETQAQNYEDGPPPDGTGGILRVDIEGNPMQNPILVRDQDEDEDEDEEIDLLDYYYAYGIRNGFGLGFDPVTGYLWDTENGPNNFDEINLVQPGFNSGWQEIQGLSSAEVNEGVDVEDDLVDFDGSGHYSDPKFVWNNTVGVTAIKFLNSTALGVDYQNDMFVGDINNGRIYHFDLADGRTDLALSGALSDSVADSPGELDSVIFGSGFRSISDIEVGPDGYLYILLYGPGKISKIVPSDEAQ